MFTITQVKNPSSESNVFPCSTIKSTYVLTYSVTKFAKTIKMLGQLKEKLQIQCSFQRACFSHSNFTLWRTPLQSTALRMTS